jgi:hypothetical protein
MNAKIRRRPAALEALGDIKEITDYVSAVRHELDALWRSARDATAPKPSFTAESNREVADNAAFEIMQCLHHVEDHLLNLLRALPAPTASAEGEHA